MSPISDDVVRHVAMLARLGLSDERLRALTKDLGSILEHMDVLRGVNTDGVIEFGQKGAAAMPLRPDVAVQSALSPPPLALAPESRDGFLLVPRLATHDDAPQDPKP
jgi:aspartyl-tRNA(Asn)/glutamyl-tRNA(Gln) amidotransferase subunit C